MTERFDVPGPIPEMGEQHDPASERRQWLLGRLSAGDEDPLTLQELAWLERNPDKTVDPGDSYEARRRQWLLAHISIHGDKPLTPQEQEWLEQLPQWKLNAIERRRAAEVAGLESIDANEPTSEPFHVEDAGTLDWLGWDNPVVEGARQTISPYWIYRSAISRIPVLEKDKQQRLTAIVTAGREAAAELAEFPDNPQAQAAVEAARAARQKLWLHNLRLVPYFIDKYQLRRGGNILSDLDLIQEGNLGLERAIDKYRPGLGAVFSTFARWHINTAVRRCYAEQSRTVRIPGHIRDFIVRTKVVRAELVQNLQREVTDRELADWLECPIEKIKNAPLFDRRTVSLDAMQADDVFDAEAFANDSDNIPEQPLNDRLESALRNADTSDIKSEAYDELRAEAVWQALETLNSREHAIIVLRWGLEDGEPKTLDEVGKEFGLTRERIRQIEARAMARLRTYDARTQLLRDWLTY